ncbi:MAG: hypothetical protein IKD40_04380 [Bacteroidaceae bacterium]|nr:hypothetical protein [Bacteroidaceae bacterium]
MKTNKNNFLKGAAIAAAILCAVQIVWLSVQSWNISGLGAENSEINWDKTILPIQLIVFLGRLIFCVAYNALIITFLTKTMKALKGGVIFPKSNVLLPFCTAGCYFIGTMLNDNFDNILMTETPCYTYFAINSSTIIFTLLFLIFALLYKMAADISEENNLTI